MGSYGGFRPYPRRYGGKKPKAKVFLDAMNASRGTAYDTQSTTTAVHVENLGIARALARAWDTNERLGNIANAQRMSLEMLERWEAIYGLTVDPADSLTIRRARLQVLQLAIGQASLTSTIATLLAAAIGPVFVAVEAIALPIANVGVPDGSFPFGVVVPGYPWFSTVNHLLIRITQPAGYRDDDFYAAAGKVFQIVDPLLPSHMTFDWYRAPVSTPIFVLGGPSAAGFYLDDPHNLDNNVFALDPPTLATLSRSLGDTLGFDEIPLVITGTNLYGATFLFGATPATSVVYNSNSQVTVIVPAHAAGSVNITAISGGYTSNALPYEFWSPAVLTPKAFWDGNKVLAAQPYPGATGDPYFTPTVGGVVNGDWPVRSSSISTTTTNLGQSTGANVPAVVRGAPQFDGGTSDLFNSNFGFTNFVGNANNQTVAMVIEIDSIDAQANDALLDEVVGEQQGRSGVFLGGAGANELVYIFFDTTAKEVRVTLSPTTGRKVVIVRVVANVLQVSLDGGATWTTGDTATGVMADNSNFGVGYNKKAFVDSGVNARFHGRMRALSLNNAAISDADASKFYQWAAARHP